jgi:hypothetical protein
MTIFAYEVPQTRLALGVYTSNARLDEDDTMTLPLRIEHDDIPLFITGCAVEALQWEVEGMRYEEWRTERGRGDDASSAWRDEVVIPYL